ncbi:MAG: hypothetical protein HXX09_09380 [Bacteroidetes bacterium]|nr:hypothetical protein [Bacteroidota bacterium]
MKFLELRSFYFKVLLLSLLLSKFSIGFAQDTTKQKDFSLNGMVGLNGIYYHSQGIDARRSPFSYVLSVNMEARYKELYVPFSVTYSEQDRSYRQAFNQFGLSPRWRWITAHFGYRNVNYSSYTLAGHTVLGAGVDLNPGLLRVGFMYGKFNRDTPYDNYSLFVNPPTFSRKGYAARIGIGNKDNFFDFIVLNIKDDSTTLYYNPKDTSSSLDHKTPPAQNVIGGFNSKFNFTKKLWFESEGAISVTTTNIIADTLDGVSDNEWLLKLNGIIPLNLSTEFYSALRAAIGYKEKLWSAKIQYRRIDPGYQSMGAYYFNNDLENITFEPMMKLFKKKIYFRGSIGYQHDNIKNTKRATSLRTIGSAFISFNPVKEFGLDLGYSNYASNQERGRLPLVDSIVLNQTTTNYTLTPRYTIFNTDKTHTFMLNFNHMQLNDKNNRTSEFNNLQLTNVLVNYTIGLIPLKTALSLGLNYTYLTLYNQNNNSIGIVVGANKWLLKNRCAVNASASINRADYNNSKSWISNFFGSASYILTKNHSFNINLYYIGNNITSPAKKNINEIKIDIGYAYKIF